MTVRWPVLAAVRCFSASRASSAEVPKKVGETVGLEVAEEMSEVVRPARKMEKIAPRVPPHESGGQGKSWLM